jgi:hypothetical protein
MQAAHSPHKGSPQGRKENTKTTHHTPIGKHATATSTEDHRKKSTKNKNAHWRTPFKNLATQNRRDTTT